MIGLVAEVLTGCLNGDTASTRELSENTVNGLVVEVFARDAQWPFTPRDLKKSCDRSDYRSPPELPSPVTGPVVQQRMYVCSIIAMHHLGYRPSADSIRPFVAMLAPVQKLTMRTTYPLLNAQPTK